MAQLVEKIANIPATHSTDEHHHDPAQHGSDYQAGVLAGYQAAKGSVSQVTHESEFNRGFVGSHVICLS